MKNRTETRRVPAGEWPEFPAENLTIRHDGNGWHGSFGLLVTTLLRDVTDEGPLDDVIAVAHDPYDPRTWWVYEGTVRGIDTTGGRIRFVNETGPERWLDIDDALAVSL